MSGCIVEFYEKTCIIFYNTGNGGGIMQFSFDKSLMDNVDVGIIVYDKDGWVQFVNATQLKFSYYTYEDFQHFNTYDIYRSNVSNVCLFDKALQTKRPATAIQHTYHGREGSNYDKLVTAIPIIDELGNVVNVVSTFIDLNDFRNKFDAAQRDANVTYDLSLSQKQQEQVIYGSDEMKKLLDTAKVIAATDIPVLITGESGTGKEVLANFIHSNSLRREGNIVVVDCASLPENLLEAELFGYEKGAFTGANSAGKRGLIEVADGGTLFLDEINSMPMPLQGKLLRVLETQQVKRIGALKGKNIDFRIVAATNANLPTCIQNGTFRLDLYYRLNVMPLVLPPLRERVGDIVPLCKYFLSNVYKRYGKARTISDAAYQTLKHYNWPGNVRELKNFIERLVITSSDFSAEIYSIPAEMLGADIRPNRHGLPTKHENIALTVAEQEELDGIVTALYQSGGNRSIAAEKMGISRRTLQYKLKKYGVSVNLEPQVYVGEVPIVK